ncbi:cupin domain-containing protein [Polynucleobacter brandtiae]|uniref:50S ribosomal protein L16 3-hydroxylase n=1 Tax=Polynucleobacter brandtiae TaxID=1938816 RepID=A0A2M8VXU8_9BURK|nr:cupin domain-containing protein [Polynucleobacter brandtiae]PJI82690.1 50S ribosomal protein L16 3-hydroxylase [Polynucleobacter brandtiae]
MTAFYLSNPYQPPQAPQTLPLELPWALLGNMSPVQFMKTHWHKKPLLVRGAIPAFKLANIAGNPLQSPISAETLIKLAGDDAVQSRLIQAKPWRFIEGPFKKKDIPTSKARHWTLLLQGMEAQHPAAATVLSWFRFIPDARLDDLMISLASIGGGVGPHFDSYDVFLIQMSGRRRWRISDQSDLSLKPKMPLKILQNFQAQQEWDLEPGDMLYLPPQVAHDGIALDAGCQTWSVGFRSPSYKELLQEGLWRLAESLEEIPGLAKHFADPKQAASNKAQELPHEMTEQLGRKLKELRLDQIDTFLPGITAYLSEPKPQAIFDGSSSNLTPAQFSVALSKFVLVPHPQTRLLTLKKCVFCNGEEMTGKQTLATQKAWQCIAAKKSLNKVQIDAINTENSLYQAYQDGWLIFEGFAPGWL